MRVFAYSLPSSQYHLLIQTLDANLSRFMQHIDGVYTQRFSRSHHVDGQRFRDRYKAILIDADTYSFRIDKIFMRHLKGDSLEEIGIEFKIAKYSSVSSAVERMKAMIGKDRRLRKRAVEMKEKINKSQEQT